MGLQQIAFDFDSIPTLPQAEEVKPVAGEKKPVEEKNVVAPENIVAETNFIEEAIVDLTAIHTEPVVTAPKAKKKSNKKQTRGRMSLKDMDAGVDLIEIPEDEILFQKMYYPIGTVSDMFKVNQSLIRFWENEFDILKPKKNGKGDRLFRPEDVKNLKLIYHLLRERKYTIEGAKDFLKHNKKAEQRFAMIESLKKIKGFLNELKANL
jgi:DNA-binding transcriptional MerR regulator